MAALHNARNRAKARQLLVECAENQHLPPSLREFFKRAVVPKTGRVPMGLMRRLRFAIRTCCVCGAPSYCCVSLDGFCYAHRHRAEYRRDRFEAQFEAGRAAEADEIRHASLAAKKRSDFRVASRMTRRAR
jgi:hypothetical protein